MTKSQLIKRIEQLECEVFANRGVVFVMSSEKVEDDDSKIIVVFNYG